MTTQMKSLVFVAAIAILPVACGTSGSPTGPEAMVEAGLSSHRNAPGAPPIHPQPQVPESDPVPGDPGPVPSPAPERDPAEGSRPLPSSRPSQDRPAPQPDTGADVVPEGVPQAGPDAVPPPVGDPGTVPPPPNPETVPVPVPPTETEACDSISIQIMWTAHTIAEPAGDQFVAVLIDESGMAIEDKSCEVYWTADAAASTGARLSIVRGVDSRHVTIMGASGPYKLGATAPNGQRDSILVGGAI